MEKDKDPIALGLPLLKLDSVHVASGPNVAPLYSGFTPWERASEQQSQTRTASLCYIQQLMETLLSTFSRRVLLFPSVSWRTQTTHSHPTAMPGTCARRTSLKLPSTEPREGTLWLYIVEHSLELGQRTM